MIEEWNFDKPEPEQIIFCISELSQAMYDNERKLINTRHIQSIDASQQKFIHVYVCMCLYVCMYRHLYVNIFILNVFSISFQAEGLILLKAN